MPDPTPELTKRLESGFEHARNPKRAIEMRAYKKSTDAARLFDYCLLRADDKEFFTRKAIGWALREYSKTDEAAVRRFVADHRSELSGLSQREALKWLDRRAAEQKSAGPPKRARARTATP